MLRRHTLFAAATFGMLALAAVPAAAQDSVQAQDVANSAEEKQPAEPPQAIVVYHFEVQEPQAEDLMDAAANMAQEPYVARIDVPDGSGAISGTLVFFGLEEFSTWREQQRDSLFESLGTTSAETSALIFRRELLQMSDPEWTGTALEELQVDYTNADNDAAGDADIDAVTVICPAEDAECSPSN